MNKPKINLNPSQWPRPKLFSKDQPQDDGRGRLTDTSQDINLGPGIPHGIRYEFYDITHGYVTGKHINAFPPTADSEVFIPHLFRPRNAPQILIGKTIDDSTPIASVYVGNPQI